MKKYNIDLCMKSGMFQNDFKLEPFNFIKHSFDQWSTFMLQTNSLFTEGMLTPK